MYLVSGPRHCKNESHDTLKLGRMIILQITVAIQAPELSSAILALAKALEVNTQGNLSAKNALATTITVLADVLESNGKTPETARDQVATTAEPDPETPEKETSKEKTSEEKTPKTEVSTEEIPTVVDLRAKAQEKGKTTEGKKAIKALLDEFGSKSVSDVPEEKRAAFLHKLEAL